jgi:hypothetical protein
MKGGCIVKTVGTSLDLLTYRFEDVVEVSEVCSIFMASVSRIDMRTTILD